MKHVFLLFAFLISGAMPQQAQTFCRIFDRLSKEGISDPTGLYRKGIMEYLK